MRHQQPLKGARTVELAPHQIRDTLLWGCALLERTENLLDLYVLGTSAIIHARVRAGVRGVSIIGLRNSSILGGLAEHMQGLQRQCVAVWFNLLITWQDGQCSGREAHEARSSTMTHSHQGKRLMAPG